MTLSYSIQMITRSLRTPSAHDHARVRGPCPGSLILHDSCSHNVTASVTLTPRLRRLFSLHWTPPPFALLSPSLSARSAFGCCASPTECARHREAALSASRTYAASRASNASHLWCRPLPELHGVYQLTDRQNRKPATVPICEHSQESACGGGHRPSRGLLAHRLCGLLLDDEHWLWAIQHAA